MIVKIKARILRITKDDMKTCSSRCIWAELVDEKSKEHYHVAWANSPTVIGFLGTWRSRAQDAFESAWEKCNEGDEVWLYHPSDDSFNYFEPLA